MRPVTWIKEAGAVAGALAAIAGLLFLFVPSLRPTTSGGADGTVTISRLTAHPKTYGQFLKGQYTPTKGLPPKQLDRFGVEVDFLATATGFRNGTKLPVYATLFTVSPGGDQTGVTQRSTELVVEGSPDGRIPVWIPVSRDGRIHYVRIEVFAREPVTSETAVGGGDTPQFLSSR